MCREGVRGVAGVALATPFFRLFYKIVQKNSQNCTKNIAKLLLLSIYTYTYIFIYAYII